MIRVSLGKLLSVMWNLPDESLNFPKVLWVKRMDANGIGSSEWIKKEKLKFKNKASIKTKFTDAKKSENRKTGKGLEDFIKNIYNNEI